MKGVVSVRGRGARAMLGVAAAAALMTPALFILGCDAVDVTESTPPHDDMSLEELEQQIQTLIATPTCQDVSSCASIAFGVKPCGGPWRYLVYSREVTDEAALTTAVSEYNELDREFNERNGVFSDCMFVSPPVLACASGVCVAG